jgi:signal transduction histidine kinase/CheY-like chemotaxis protein
METQRARDPHRLVIVLICLILAAASIYATLFDTIAVTLGAGLAVASALVACSRIHCPERLRATGLAVLGMVAVGVLIHAARGRSEAHFAVFVFLAFLPVYRDWLPIVAAALTVGLHHFLFNFLQQRHWGPVCFVEPSLGRAIEHAIYVTADTALLVVMALRARREMSGLHAMNESTKNVLTRIRATTAALGGSAWAISPDGARRSSDDALGGASDSAPADRSANLVGGEDGREATTQLAEATSALDAMAAEREQAVRQHTDELRRACAEAVAASQAKSAFLANMSHEIRTPLTSIIGFAELLLQPGSSPIDPRVSLQTIIRNGRHLLDVINDILDLAKIETQRMELEEIDLPLATLLRDVYALVSGRAQERGLEFVVTPHMPLPTSIRTDPVRLKQVLINFCSNAIKFTSSGSVTLDLCFLPQVPALRFSVIDTGVGMTREQIGKLFKPFVQADVSTTREFGGTGLGLYISQQLATLLGGRIAVHSELGRGSRFDLELKLPAALSPAELLTLEGDLIDYGRTDFAITTLPAFDIAGRVLLAEDGRDNQRLITAYLQQAGLSVSVANNGREAVEAALGQDFDLVLMDVQMPVMDGVAATRMLRAAGYRQPIIALTANVMKEDIERYRDAGCDHVLGKPLDREQFYEVIARHLAIAGPSGVKGDVEFEREMADMKADFQAGLPAQADSIRKALHTPDWAALATLTHTLKGTAGSFGYGRLTEMAGAVEADVRAGRTARAAVQCEGLLLELANSLRRFSMTT